MQNAILAASAIVYIPAGRPVGWNLARQYWTYLQRRGYVFYAVDRDLDHALGELDSHHAQVIVMPTAYAERADPGGTTVIDLGVRRDRALANEPTIRLPSPNSGPSPNPPRDDGGFAERFLKERGRSRNTRDT